jgi:hypothetical protein
MEIGLNGTQLAELLGWTQTMLSRTLSGRRPTLDIDVSAFLAICQVTGEQRRRILQLSRPYEDSRFLRLPEVEQWSAYLAHAGTTVRLVEFQPFVIPWTLQTPDYTHALLSTSGTIPADQVERNFHSRRGAISLLRLPRVELLLHEWSLRTPLQDTKLMSDQLHHLLTISVGPTVSVRVVPIGKSVYVGQWPFTLLEFEDDSPVVYREEAAAGVFVDSAHEITAYQTIVDRLNGSALNETESRTMIGQIATELYGEPSSEPDLPKHFAHSWIT